MLSDDDDEELRMAIGTTSTKPLSANDIEIPPSPPAPSIPQSVVPDIEMDSEPIPPHLPLPSVSVPQRVSKLARRPRSFETSTSGVPQPPAILVSEPTFNDSLNVPAPSTIKRTPYNNTSNNHNSLGNSNVGYMSNTKSTVKGQKLAPMFEMTKRLAANSPKLDPFNFAVSMDEISSNQQQSRNQQQQQQKKLFVSDMKWLFRTKYTSSLSKQLEQLLISPPSATAASAATDEVEDVFPPRVLPYMLPDQAQALLLIELHDRARRITPNMPGHSQYVPHVYCLDSDVDDDGVDDDGDGVDEDVDLASKIRANELHSRLPEHHLELNPSATVLNNSVQAPPSSLTAAPFVPQSPPAEPVESVAARSMTPISLRLSSTTAATTTVSGDSVPHELLPLTSDSSAPPPSQPPTLPSTMETPAAARISNLAASVFVPPSSSSTGLSLSQTRVTLADSSPVIRPPTSNVSAASILASGKDPMKRNTRVRIMESPPSSLTQSRVQSRLLPSQQQRQRQHQQQLWQLRSPTKEVVTLDSDNDEENEEESDQNEAAAVMAERKRLRAARHMKHAAKKAKWLKRVGGFFDTEASYDKDEPGKHGNSSSSDDESGGSDDSDESDDEALNGFIVSDSQATPASNLLDRHSMYRRAMHNNHRHGHSHQLTSPTNHSNRRSGFHSNGHHSNNSRNSNGGILRMRLGKGSHLAAIMEAVDAGMDIEIDEDDADEMVESSSECSTCDDELFTQMPAQPQPARKSFASAASAANELAASAASGSARNETAPDPLSEFDDLDDSALAALEFDFDLDSI
ncbi:hypothetical protein GQ42DRAFT_35899 [Ramicandelaber brevisporus]|nr:hypothetical protein GQ42DRAFT_35899 [Ramicandelaber brevisporus]